MKIRPLLFTILCLAGPGIAEDETQIRIDTKIQSGDDLLSAPSVVALSGQHAKIEVIREILVALKGVNEFPVAVSGVTLSINPIHEEGHILLTGKLTISEKPQTHSNDKDMAYVSLQVSETTFVIKAKPGKSYQLKVPNAKEEGKNLSVEITPSLVERQNASVLYWQAFAALPALEPDDHDKLEKDDPAIVARFDRALEKLHAASALKVCDWNLDLSEGPEMELPQVSKARLLTKGGLARARLRFARGETDAALEDVIAVFRLGRHIANPGLLITNLVGYASEKDASDLVRKNLGKLNSEQKGRLAKALEELIPFSGIKVLLESEKTLMVDWLRNRLIGIRASGKPLKDDEIVKQLGLDPKNLAADVFLRMLDETKGHYDELAKIATAPREGRAEQFANLLEKVKTSGNIISALVLPALDTTVEKDLQTREEFRELQELLK